MLVSINEENLGTYEAVVDSIDGWNVPLTCYGDYEEGEKAETHYHGQPSNFRVGLIWIDAAEGVRPNIYNRAKSRTSFQHVSEELLAEIEVAIRDFIEED